MSPASNREHTPKTRALLALEAEQLSRRGVQRLHRHLETCEICRQEQAALRLYDRLRLDEKDWLEARVQHTDSVDVEALLERERTAALSRPGTGRKVSPRQADYVRRAGWLGGLAAAAAAALVLQLTPRGDSPQAGLNGGTGRGNTSASQPRVVTTDAVVTAVSGPTQLRTPAGWVSVAAGTRVVEGDRLRVAPNASAHLATRDQTASWTLLPDTTVTVERMRQRSTRELALRLEHGAVVCAVEREPAGGKPWSASVLAKDWEVLVRGTRFGVALSKALAVQVAEGEVAVMKHGHLVASLSARQQFGFGPPLSLKEPFVFRHSDGPWGVLELAHGDVDHWEIDGFRLPVVAGVVQLQVPSGLRRLVGYQSGDIIVEDWVEVGHHLTWRGRAPRPRAPARKVGTLERSQILPVIQAGMRRLQACYRQAGLRGSEIGGRFSLRILVGRTGEVLEASLQGQENPPARFRGCVEGAARNWLFPPPVGGVVRFEQPLRFTARLP